MAKMELVCTDHNGVRQETVILTALTPDRIKPLRERATLRLIRKYGGSKARMLTGKEPQFKEEENGSKKIVMHEWIRWEGLDCYIFADWIER